MKKNKCVPLILLIITLSLCGGAVFSGEKNHKTKLKYLNTYSKQTTLACDDYSLSIPSYLPFYNDYDESLYAILSSELCNSNKYEIIWSAFKDCNGQHDCVSSFFSKNSVTNNLRDPIERSFEELYETVTLTNNIKGYYLPSQCFAYCTHAKLFWFSRSIIYSIGTVELKGKNATRSELVKAAKSFIEKE